MVKITEEQAREMWRLVELTFGLIPMEDRTIDIWKEHGFIEEVKFE